MEPTGFPGNESKKQRKTSSARKSTIFSVSESKKEVIFIYEGPFYLLCVLRRVCLLFLSSVNEELNLQRNSAL